ncbi:CD99 antigen isoform X2 [Molossus molossus]|uniref:CD99 molecule (Xg blood group) n=1 Tax=Molossus molossus TaxID=27622 RepID=A0A7J8J5Y8_MOLMO|nr:CD99 antigen isoform X2 [Molossus molossus]KAF6491860.1 CD99 molecule (Xg blood group) [Molossus molossus]
MARRAVFALLLCCLLGAALSDQDDFDLSDAVDDFKKPMVTTKKPSSGDDFSLEDGLGDGGHMTPAPPKPKPNPQPNHPGTSGGFSDSDLFDATSGGAEPQGVIPGIIGAIVVAVAGAISSFIAYQKKKFCFKENAEQGDINMENHQNIKTEPPVQQTLLAK